MNGIISSPAPARARAYPFHRTKPKEHNILKTKNHYFPENLVIYVNEIQALHENGSMNESAKIEALKRYFQKNEFTQLLTLLNARRKIMLKEFNVLNAKNNALTKNNNKLKNIGATINALTELVNQMKSMKKKSKNVPLLSTIHGNAQQKYFGFKEGNKNENGTNNGLSVMGEGRSRAASMSSLASQSSQRSFDTNISNDNEENVLDAMYDFGIQEKNFARYVRGGSLNTKIYNHGTSDSTVAGIGSAASIPENNILTIDNLNNKNSYLLINFIEQNFDNDSNDCYRNSALHLLLTILKSIPLKKNDILHRNIINMNDILFNPSNTNIELKNFLSNILNNQRQRKVPYYTLTSGIQKFKPINNSMTTTQQDTNEYLNELLDHFINPRVKSILETKRFDLKGMSDEIDENRSKNVMSRGFSTHIILNLPENFISTSYATANNNLQLIINNNLIDVFSVPVNNSFIIIEISPYENSTNTQSTRHNFFIDNDSIVNIKGNFYIINDIIYHTGNIKSGHYICHSRRHYKLNNNIKSDWIIYDDQNKNTPVYYTDITNKPNNNYFNNIWSPTTILLKKVNIENIENTKQLQHYDPKKYIDILITYIKNVCELLDINSNQNIILQKNIILNNSRISDYYGNIIVNNKKNIIEIKASIFKKYMYMIHKMYPNTPNNLNRLNQIITFIQSENVEEHNKRAIDQKRPNINISSLYKNNILKEEYQTDNFIVFLK